MGGDDREGKIQLHFCKHHLLLSFHCGARSVEELARSAKEE